MQTSSGQATDHPVGSKVLYRGYNFSIEATIREVKATKFGTTEVLLQPATGFPMWRSLGQCVAIEAKAG